jgi:hypothetical protein
MPLAPGVRVPLRQAFRSVADRFSRFVLKANAGVAKGLDFVHRRDELRWIVCLANRQGPRYTIGLDRGSAQCV